MSANTNIPKCLFITIEFHLNIQAKINGEIQNSYFIIMHQRKGNVLKIVYLFFSSENSESLNYGQRWFRGHFFHKRSRKNDKAEKLLL